MLEILSILFGSSSIITVLLFMKQSKRVKNAEAFGKEVEALKETVETLRAEVRFDKERISQLQSEVLDLTSRRRKTLENMYQLLRTARTCPYIEHPDKCPVLTESTKVSPEE